MLEPYNLTRAETKVVELACRGLTNPEIAARLGVSTRTVQSHLYNVFKKLGVATRSGLVAFVYEERASREGNATGGSGEIGPDSGLASDSE